MSTPIVGDKYRNGRRTVEIVEVTETHVTYTVTGGALDSRHTSSLAEFAVRETRTLENGAVFYPCKEDNAPEKVTLARQLETELATAKGELARVSEELGLPPAIGPAPGSLKKWREDVEKLRAELAAERAKVAKLMEVAK